MNGTVNSIKFAVYRVECEVLSIVNCEFSHRLKTKDTQRVSTRMKFQLTLTNNPSLKEIERLGSVLKRAADKLEPQTLVT